MRLIKLMVVCSIFALALTAVSCKKEKFNSRDLSGIVKPEDPEEPEEPEPTLVLFDAADASDGWEVVGGASVETAGKKQGTGYLKGVIPDGGDYMHFIRTLPTPVNSTFTKANGQFTFWLFISSVADIKADGQIELTSSGKSDSKEYAWSVGALLPSLRNGWNEVVLNFKDAEVSGDGEPDLAALNHFRIFFWTNTASHAEVTVGVDGLGFVSGDDNEPEEPSVAGIYDNADSEVGWESVGTLTVETVGRKEGTGYLKNVIPNGGDYMHFIRTLTVPVNPNLTKANGQFSFWFYVSNVAEIKADGQIELTSSGKSDSKEYAWQLGPLVPNLVNGWNEMKLNFKDAEVSGDGEPDLTAFNHFRIYFWTNSAAHDDVVVGIDDLKFLELPPPEPVANSFDNANSIDGWDQAGERELNTQDKKEGSGSLRFFIGGGDALRMQKTLATPMNTGLAQDNGQLRFWLWIEDASLIKLTDGQIELTSSGGPDAKEYAWPTSSLPALNNGWNEIMLNFSDAQVSGDGGPDLAAINFFRMYFNTTTPVADGSRVTFGVDDIRVVSK